MPVPLMCEEGHQMSPGQTYCTRCGKPLKAVSIEDRVAALEADVTAALARPSLEEELKTLLEGSAGEELLRMVVEKVFPGVDQDAALTMLRELLPKKGQQQQESRLRRLLRWGNTPIKVS